MNLLQNTSEVTLMCDSGKMIMKLAYRKTVFIIAFFNILETESFYTWNYVKDSVTQLLEEPKNTIIIKKVYDFIVVGAGTAGCTLANRLTEVDSWDVLLVEAGGHEYFYEDIPLLANSLQLLTPADWHIKTEPSDKYCTGFNNNQCHFARGKVVGGSSVLNYMVYTRGSPHDYDNWAALGNDGWSWKDVLPYLKKVENFNINEYYDPHYHSRDGYLNVEYTPYRTNKSKAWIKAAEEYGFKHGDYNGPIPSSVVSNLELSMKDGTRHSASRAYLHPIRNRANLFLLLKAYVTKLLFNTAKTTVIGVELKRNGILFRVYARKEVILSAGAIKSPQLLMLSGIGPKKHLFSLGIPVAKDLPVGYNLMDHIATGGLHFTVNETVNTVSLKYALTHYYSVIAYYMNEHRGPLASPGGTEALIFTNLEDKFNNTAWSDLELYFAGSSYNGDPTIEYASNYRHDIYKQFLGPLGNRNAYVVYPMLLRPKSRGRIKLRNRDPYSVPIIVPNYFEYEEDLETIVQGIRLAIELTKQPSLRAIDAKLYDVPIKQCLSYGPFASDEYFKCMTRMFTQTIYHYSGTCKMGKVNDRTAVVDSELRVHGIANIRIVDASIMPVVPAGHINAPVFMIAEKAGDLIKNAWEDK